MAKRQVFTVPKCVMCQDFIEQAARGRPRLTCSDACRQARYRLRHGKESRYLKRVEKIVKKRRALPFGERQFDSDFHEPIRELSYRRWIYECLACGQPYLVERIKNGNRAKSFCSDACEAKANYHWKKYADALAKLSMVRRVDQRVMERFDYQKLSPLCAHCRLPFAPNTTLYGQRKRGRPRKFCSDRCRKAAYEKRWKQGHSKARGHRFGGCLDCGERIDRKSSKYHIRQFCDPICAGRFKQRAYRARQKMKAKGQTEFIYGKSGYGIAARTARKNRKTQLQEMFCNKNGELASGRSEDEVYSEGS